MDYITLDDIKIYTGQTYNEQQETALTAIGDALEIQMERYCNRSFKADTFTETFDGGVTTFLVKNPPISSIDSVTVDGRLLSEDKYFNYESYIRIENKTNHGLQNVIIEYTSETILPLALKNALIEWVIDVYENQTVSGIGVATEDIKSISVGPVSLNYGQSSQQGEGIQTTSSSGLLSGIPEDVADVLKMYRKNPL